jgi:hypothetical protein
VSVGRNGCLEADAGPVTPSQGRRIVQVMALDQWLTDDMLRPADERRFQFHTFRGAKRIWTEAAFQNLRAAIERESLSGGVLARSSSRNVTAIGTPRVASSLAVERFASERVSAFPVASTSFCQAEIALAEFVDDEKARLTGQAGRGDSIAVAALGYLNALRARPLGASTIRIIKKIKNRFDGRRLNAIGLQEWRAWVPRYARALEFAMDRRPVWLRPLFLDRRPRSIKQLLRCRVS